jgi:hypothetical protein
MRNSEHRLDKIILEITVNIKRFIFLMQNFLTEVLRISYCTGPMCVYMCVCAWQRTCMYILICAFHLRLYSRTSMTYKQLYSILPTVIHRHHEPWPCECVGLVTWRPMEWLSPSQIQSFSNFPVVRDMTPCSLVCGDLGCGGIVCPLSPRYLTGQKRQQTPPRG